MIYSKDVTSLPDLAHQIVSPRFDVVTQPVDVLSLQNLIIYAIENGIPIVPRGNGTSGWGGAIPTRGGLCISLSAMSGILYFNEFESAVTVETGITWRDLLAFLERLGFTLPVYPSSATAATVGGFVASGGLGIGSTRNGDILKQVIGIEAILPNGKIVRLGRLLLDSKTDPLREKVEEGNSWLSEKLSDAGLGSPEQETKLFTGTYGTLGIITKVTLKTIPNLQLIPFSCSFDRMTDLVRAADRILSEVKPYYMRFLADNYTSKLRALSEYENESGKYILTGALLDTIYQNEDNIEIIKTVTNEEKGYVLDDKRSWFYWSERLYPLRIKRHGPSLVPAEMLAPMNMLPEILEKTKAELRNSKVAIEGTLSNDGTTSFMVWILDDERKKVSFTIGWYRSFQIASLAERFGGLPYAVGLWNGRHARKFYGNDSYKNLKVMKKKLDPSNIMNPLKVFGGRVTIGRESMLLGFLLGFIVTMIGGWLLPGLLNLDWLNQFLSLSLVQFLYFPNLWLLGLAGGLIAVMIIRFMRLSQALAIGIPILRILSKLLRR
ncbi:MAG: FAD-binding oxidoreductase [Candidatus Thorarchaeota archaeon]|nr:FAD-binding oxidoreductase [Candidatus Thorarchaeota archaeon]